MTASTLSQQSTPARPRMSAAQIDARALARATDERVRINAVPGLPGRYWTSSKSAPGVRYALVDTGREVACSCPGFQYRASCKHVAGLLKRLGRTAAQAAHPADVSDLY